MVGAVIYVRVSTKEQTENLSLPTQLRAGEPGILDAHDVEVGFPAKQSSDDVAVEVLVCRESQHGRARC